MTSPMARALLESTIVGPREARAAAVERARRKPTPAAAFEARGAVGGGVSPRLQEASRLKGMVEGTSAALQKCAYDLRRAVAHRLGLRFVPRLHFFLWEGQRSAEGGKSGAGEARASVKAPSRATKGGSSAVALH